MLLKQPLGRTGGRGKGGIDTAAGLLSSGGTPLEEGASFLSGGASWTISYIGGTGNDVTLTVAPATASSLAMTAFSIAEPIGGGGGGKLIQGAVSGPPDASIRLMRSFNLSDWTPLTTILLNASGEGGFEVIDPLATDRAFYRLALP